ncbi:acetate/propionate family kinase [Mahella australiensis]|uniref:Acetate kinase n=1 Tax=Mahella australiensis (strain DSM 15567 / CIP 107919 / 50-1 BON) TaxID=697281 RepID=F4A1I4_MAHA5|nr:acetate kinase [Mahella australiensis]AEE96018.1 acetate kinase [Mahella australiensis 50-1 BON]
MNILVLNCGGSSVKFQVFDMPSERVIAKGMVERIGKTDAVLHYSSARQEAQQRVMPISDHKAAISMALSTLTDDDSIGAIDAIGHRLVHGGERYTGAVFIDDEVLSTLKEYAPLAPLHNPPNALGIEACKQLMPDIVQVGLFDTALHQKLPDYAYTYALPYRYYEKYRVRRYGFHGIAFTDITERTAQIMRKPLNELRIISLMLGSGTTANAMKYGRSVDVSTGLTPLQGLVQSTRSGDIDPAAVTYIMRQEGLSTDQMDDVLNKQSGWLGISGVSNDLREVEQAAATGNERARLAIDTFVYSCKKYVGAYAAAMGGFDVLAFSGGIGEKSSHIRQKVCQGLEFLGIELDQEKNNAGIGPRFITTEDSKTKAVVVSVDEELVIAQQTYDLIDREGR